MSQSLRRQFAEEFMIVSGELPHVPESPGG